MAVAGMRFIESFRTQTHVLAQTWLCGHQIGLLAFDIATWNAMLTGDLQVETVIGTAA